MTQRPLHVHVLVTRPAGQEQPLVGRLQAAGYRVSYQPALSIDPLPLDGQARSRLMNLDEYHAVFVVSANAARLGLEALETIWPQWPVGVNWIAVGDATAALLDEAGLRPWLPEQGFNSEAVLALPPLQSLKERKVLVLRGEQGRELFADSLRQRGAQVDAVVLYRRRCNGEFRWPAQRVDILLVTSVQSWQCLENDVDAGTLVLAGSERIADAVRRSGHRHLRVAASPRDSDMLAAIGMR